jgi:hypothetical protein
MNGQHTPYTLSCNNPHLSELANQHESFFPNTFFFLVRKWKKMDIGMSVTVLSYNILHPFSAIHF